MQRTQALKKNQQQAQRASSTSSAFERKRQEPPQWHSIAGSRTIPTTGEIHREGTRGKPTQKRMIGSGLPRGCNRGKMPHKIAAVTQKTTVAVTDTPTTIETTPLSKKTTMKKMMIRGQKAKCHDHISNGVITRTARATSMKQRAVGRSGDDKNLYWYDYPHQSPRQHIGHLLCNKNKTGSLSTSIHNQVETRNPPNALKVQAELMHHGTNDFH